MAQGANSSATVLAVSVWLVLAHGAALSACKDEGDDHTHGEGGHGGHNHEEPVGPPSKAVCPDDSMLTYENFGKSFMEDYCTRCHSSQLKGETARNGAPDDHDFDTIEGIWEMQDHIDQMAAAGPTQVNVMMPLGDPKPTVEQRRLLGEWLACDAPEE